MKVTMITGSYPPDTCGVGDYTSHLVETLRVQGITVDIVSKENWDLKNIANIARRISKIKADIMHIQYPTVGFGAKLSPQLLSLIFPCIVTLHEISQAHIIRRLSLYPFSFRSKHIIFTSTLERDYALRWSPWIFNHCSVIPIGSNIRIRKQDFRRDIKEIVYFGLIRPQKGLEDVFFLASLIKQLSLGYGIRIIGKRHPKFIDYYDELYRRSKALPIIWDVDLSESAVAEVLSRSRIAYVPFPDGVSARRGSLLALLANGVATITTRGTHTPPQMERVVEFAQNPEQALQLIQRIASDNEHRRRLINNGLTYASNFTWEAIATKHVEVYEKVIFQKAFNRRGAQL